MSPHRFAYYCSGHGYGHATRVSAFARHLLDVQGASVHIVTSAPRHVFADSIARGAFYRYAEIDPVVVQPLAYRVDRRKSVEALERFLRSKDALLEIEREWLVQVGASAVLSDAAFLGCLAAKAAGIPSVLITNFTFDSVYSFLSTPILDNDIPTLEDIPKCSSSHDDDDHLVAPSLLSDGQPRGPDADPDAPIALAELEPLVRQIFDGYRCADLLLLLPGCIPIPSFFVRPALPAQDWVDPWTGRLRPEVERFLSGCAKQPHELHPSVPFRDAFESQRRVTMPRAVIPAPLLVRPPTSSIYTPSGRSKFLSSIGVPLALHDPTGTKILIVSFGGQAFRAPTTSSSRPSSRNRSRSRSRSPASLSRTSSSASVRSALQRSVLRRSVSASPGPDGGAVLAPSPALPLPKPLVPAVPELPAPMLPLGGDDGVRLNGDRGALRGVGFVPVLTTLPPTPDERTDGFRELGPDGPGIQDSAEDGDESDEGDGEDAEVEARLLPDPGTWIAIVCGVAEHQIRLPGEDGSGRSGLPERFFIAPKDVYMPDLTAVGDVLLGKLGYGTVSECIDSCTPFVFVSRPLFIEEHGLRLLLDREGVGVELSRQAYEDGDWADAVGEAWVRGRERKAEKRRKEREAAEGGCERDKMGSVGEPGERERQCEELAERVIEWTREWWAGQ